MAVYEVTDPITGRKVRLTRDSPPTEQELEEIFAALGGEESAEMSARLDAMDGIKRTPQPPQRPMPWERYAPGAPKPWERYGGAPSGEEMRRGAVAELARRELARRREAQQPGPERRSFLQQLGHDAAYAAGQVMQGATSLVTFPIDALGELVTRAEIAALGPTYEVTRNGQKVTMNRADMIGAASRSVPEALQAAGVPTRPETRAEEVAGSVFRSIGGAAAGMGIGGVLSGSANATAAGVGRTLAANPAIQTTSAVTGALGSEAAKELGYGPAGQIVGGIAGAVAPSIVVAGSQAALRGGLRGGERGRERVRENLETFNRAGTKPTVGQATQSRVARATEAGLSRAPGSAGRMVQTAQTQADEVGAQLERRARELVGRTTSAEQAGRQIERAIRGEGGFVAQFKAKQTQLYDALDEFIPRTQFVRIDRTQQALQALNAPIPGAPNVSRFFQNARIRDITEALQRDVQPDGTIPYEAIKKLRTLVGNEIADAGLISDVPRSKWNALYASLSDDLGRAVDDNPQAKAAWTRANNYTRAGMRRIESIDSVLNRNGGPEAIFRAATSGTKEGATTLRAVMQSVDDDGRRMISATVVRRLGLAKAGVQSELGDQFSAESFLTNWNLLSREAKATLFNRYGGRFRADMDHLAKFAANLREGSQVFRNPSGTAQAAIQATTYSSLAVSAFLGRLDVAASVLGTVGAANLLSRLMTNPRFVRFLSQSTRVPVGVAPALVNNLIQQAKATGDVDLAQAGLLLQGSDE